MNEITITNHLAERLADAAHIAGDRDAEKYLRAELTSIPEPTGFGAVVIDRFGIWWRRGNYQGRAVWIPADAANHTMQWWRGLEHPCEIQFEGFEVEETRR